MYMEAQLGNDNHYIRQEVKQEKVKGSIKEKLKCLRKWANVKYGKVKWKNRQMFSMVSKSKNVRLLERPPQMQMTKQSKYSKNITMVSKK